MKKILVVDDSATARSLVIRSISETTSEIEIMEAEDGIQGNKFCQNEKFDLIISDINMPNLNGIEMLKLLRKDGKNTNTDFIFVTTEVTSELKKKSTELNVRLWIPKPFNTKKLKLALTKLLIEEEPN